MSELTAEWNTCPHHDACLLATHALNDPDNTRWARLGAEIAEKLRASGGGFLEIHTGAGSYPDNPAQRIGRAKQDTEVLLAAAVGARSEARAILDDAHDQASTLLADARAVLAAAHIESLRDDVAGLCADAGALQREVSRLAAGVRFRRHFWQLWRAREPKDV